MLKKFPLLLLLLATISPTQAWSSSINGESYDEGTIAQFHPIGFSEDKKIFAFEEYGEVYEYGTFSRIYLLDTEKNTFLPGTPVGTKDSELDDLVPLFQVRLNTWTKAAPLIRKYAVDEAYTKLFAYNPVSEINDKSNILKFRMEGHSNDLYEIQLKPKKFPAVANCPSAPLGFSLEMNAPAKQMIYEDKSLPESRNCVLRYELIAVVGNYGGTSMIAMIKGTSDVHDESWIAIPFAEVPEN